MERERETDRERQTERERERETERERESEREGCACVCYLKLSLELDQPILEGGGFRGFLGHGGFGVCQACLCGRELCLSVMWQTSEVGNFICVHELDVESVRGLANTYQSSKQECTRF